MVQASQHVQGEKSTVRSVQAHRGQSRSTVQPQLTVPKPPQDPADDPAAQSSRRVDRPCIVLAVLHGPSQANCRLPTLVHRGLCSSWGRELPADSAEPIALAAGLAVDGGRVLSAAKAPR